MNFLPISFSEYRVEFVNFNRETLTFDSINRTRRQGTYAKTKATRMVRVAFESLRKYSETNSRNIQSVDEKSIKESHYELRMAIDLARGGKQTPIRRELNLAVQSNLSDWSDELFTKVIEYYEPRNSSKVETAILKVMTDVAQVLMERFERGENVSWGD